jgi:NDP-sugar pyrophosphorylase family protein
VSLTLVVLAAGLGTRYGGLKQLDRLGPGGSTLMDFALFDAWRAGFGRVVFVLRPELEAAFQSQMGGRYRDRLEVALAFQRLDDLPAGIGLPPARIRPWGTVQAVLAARDLLKGPFAVLNADDFYGREALALAAGFLRGRASSGKYGVIAYRLDRTLSAAGGVNRAVLELAADGSLRSVVEVRDLVVAGEAIQGRMDGLPMILPPDALVSMNLWALHPAVLGPLARGFRRFLESAPGEREEYYLPDAMRELIAGGTALVSVIPTASPWCGVTHPADRPRVEAVLRGLVEAGEYPERMWPGD